MQVEREITTINRGFISILPKQPYSLSSRVFRLGDPSLSRRVFRLGDPAAPESRNTLRTYFHKAVVY
ncbi:MAG: hypothetical protein IPF78_10440 [Flavobacteriales bacterium]|nr:hypothetical protein [Flavobacteriales bacterium]